MPGGFDAALFFRHLLMYIETVPLALAAPAIVASAAYLNARTGFSYDVRLFGSVFKAQLTARRRLRNDKVNAFYILESHALGKQANATLIIFEGRQWTYRQTYEAVLKYGHWLKTVHNVKPKEIVAMDYMNSEKFIFLWFGLWSIGAKPAFINYNLTGKTLAHCIKSSTARLVLVDPEVEEYFTQEVRSNINDIQIVVISPKLEVEILALQAAREPDASRSEDKLQNTAALIYTSGTTGLPKPAIMSWSKVNGGTVLVPNWASYSKNDVLYTVFLIFLRTV